MTPIERAARVLHKRYVEERIRNGVKPPDLPTWEDLGEDGRFYFTAPVRDVLEAIRIDDPLSPILEAGRCTTGHWNRMIDALLEEGR